MRALWLENRKLRLRKDAPGPSAPEGEAIVRVRVAGVCNTDLELVKGYYPFTGIPGHEFVGVVEKADSAPEWVGRRVVGEINAVCGACSTCQAGRPTHCEKRTVLGIVNRNGAFATHLALPVANLHAVPDEISNDVAVFAEPTAAALEVQEQVRVKKGDRVLVVGTGKLGHLVARTLLPTGCDLLAIGRSPRPLALLESCGVSTGTADDVADRTFDLAVECTGNPEGLGIARRAVRPRGTVVLKSTYRGTASLDMAPLVVDEITLVGSRCGPFGKALELLARGGVDPRVLVDERFGLEGGVEAFEAAARPGTLKVLVDC